jgi:hypothetical protein
MNNPYDVHSWSRQCREEALREARAQCLADSARAARKRLSGRGTVGLAWVSVLTRLSRLRPSV